MTDADVIQTGYSAALAKGEASRHIDAEETRILDKAVAAQRAGILTADHARDAIAQITALRELTFALDKKVRKASDAQARIMSPGSQETATRSR